MIAEAKILIATPAAGGMVTAAYTNAVFNIVKAFRDQRPRVAFDLRMCVGTELHMMRNFFAGVFMAESYYSHLLFIDADTIISPKLVAKLLDFDKPFVGSLVPFRAIDRGRLLQAARVALDAEEAISLALNYVAADELIPVHGTSATSFHVSDGFVRSRRIGAGAMLVRRDVFDRMAVAYGDLMLDGGAPYYRSLGHDGPVLQCFAPLQAEDGSFFSEDISFCERWSRLGGEIWACVTENVSHIGPYAFTGRYVDRMRRGLFQAT